MRRICYLLLTCSTFLVIGCVTERAHKRLDVLNNQQAKSLSTLQRQLTTGKVTPIQWDQAVRRMETHNITFHRSTELVKQAQKGRRRTWWSLAPDIFTFANISQNIEDISDLTSDDISFSAVANLNIPNPIRFYAQLYADYLNQLHSEWNHEVSRRNLHVQLYHFYSTQNQLNTSKRELETLRARLENSSHSHVQKKLVQLYTKQIRLEEQEEQFRVQLNRLLNTPGKRWKLTGKPPNISYANKLNTLSLQNGYGALGLKLQALSIESSIISIWNAKVSRLPSLNIGVSPPPLLNSNAGKTQSFELEQTSLFSGANYSVKISDPLKRKNLQNTKLRAKIAREELLLSSEADASRLHLLKTRYRRLIQQEKILNEELQTYKKRDLATLSAKSSVAYLKNMQQLEKKIQHNKHQQLQFDLQLWIWDEKYWDKS